MGDGRSVRLHQSNGAGSAAEGEVDLSRSTDAANTPLASEKTLGAATRSSGHSFKASLQPGISWRYEIAATFLRPDFSNQLSRRCTLILPDTDSDQDADTSACRFGRVMRMNHSDEVPYGRVSSTSSALESALAVSPSERLESAESSSSAADRSFLRLEALREITGWKSASPESDGVRTLLQAWKRAFRSIRRTEKWAYRLTLKGSTIPSEIRPITDNFRKIRAALRGSREALKGEALRRLPVVQIESRILLRAYATVQSFLQATQFTFEEHDLATYLHAAQELQPLDINEIWLLKPLLQLVFLERIGAAAESLCRELEGRARASSLHLRSGGQNRDALSDWILSLQIIDHLDWNAFFEGVSHAEKILREDPAGVYPRMEPESRDLYRQVIVRLAAHSPRGELEIAAAAIDLARQAQTMPDEDIRLSERKKHVGYYLVDEGKEQLENTISYRPPFHKRMEKAILHWPDIFYIVGIEVITVGLITFLLSGLHPVLPIFGAIALLLLPATESAVRIMNQLVSFLIDPRRLPKLDFSEGIPAECATLVVVPTLLISEKQVRETVAELEVRYLANADPNLHFALLTDSPDSTQPFDEKDELVRLCSKLIERLNQKYVPQGRGSFFLFHRHRVYNPVEGTWMGWERKRGKLLDLNNLLRHNFDSFPVKIGNLAILPEIRYVITLDSDTQLPRDVAHKLVGTLAHPLNQAVIDPHTNTVVKGYGILQPRVGISVHSVARSRLASIYSGQTGFDLYTRAISDVYQDLFGEGSFTGKGIYEVDVYQRVLGERFPCNALLSHDLIEGAYARAGLVSDIEVIDDYPSHFSAYSRRKHRWVRGDWQILRWLLGRVPDYYGNLVPNPLSFISRWKILDNLRRSLIEAATLALLIAGWFFLPGGALYWTIATLILLLAPSYLQLVLSMIAAGSSENWKGALQEAARGFMTEQVNVFFTLIFLFHQALVTLDAIVRTLIRLGLTHRRLLEWETAAQAELRSKKRTPVEISLDLTPWLSIALGVAIALVRPRALPVALPFLFAWACSKLVCRWLDLPLPPARSQLSPGDELLLRHSALRIWRFFREWSRESSNWLIPDNVQESPHWVANIISPTNLGLLLNARLAAYDMGYLTTPEFARETERSLDAARRLPRYKGHFLNWNSIEKLDSIQPLFVSTVDSGNLAACLWTLKQGCLEMIWKPLFSKALWHGLRDHLSLLTELIEHASPRHARASLKPAAGILKELARSFDSLGENSLAWISFLPEAERKIELFEAKLSQGDHGQTPIEALWWAKEFRIRLESTRQLAASFAPWTLPEYQPLVQNLSLGVGVSPDHIILQSLPQALAEMRNQVQKLVESCSASAFTSDSDVIASIPMDPHRSAHCPRAEPSALSTARPFVELLQTSIRNAEALTQSLRRLAEVAETLVAEMDFGFLYNPTRRLLSIGYHVATQHVETPCYDLLASEARTATFIAIAKGDIRQQSWFRLGRGHTICYGERVLLSWSGTLFEYLMPALWIKSYPDTILGQSQQAAVRCHQKFGRRKHRPWGVSEAGYSRRDAAGRYQYQAFGIPGLAYNPDTESSVVAPYATFLALETDPASAVQNLHRMKRMGWIGTYGFYESADFKPRRGTRPFRYELVRSWMAHHQGMSLLAVCNLLNESSIQKRFHAEPRVQATELILHERVPATVPVVPTENPGSEKITPEPFDVPAPA